MTADTHPIRHTRPIHEGLHPFVYRSMIGLTIWLVLSVWVFFDRGTYVGLTIAMITVFFVIVIAIPVLIWKTWQHNAPAEETREPTQPFDAWASQRFATGPAPSPAARRRCRSCCRSQRCRSACSSSAWCIISISRTPATSRA
jgi:uncharacterized membrane protein